MTMVAILTLILLPVVHPEGIRRANDADGVWSVTSCLVNGKEETLEKNLTEVERTDRERRYDEIIICRDRLVFVETSGFSMACNLKRVTTEPQPKYAVTKGKCHDQTGEVTYMIVVRERDKLTLAMVPPGAKKNDRAVGGQQGVIAAERR